MVFVNQSYLCVFLIALVGLVGLAFLKLRFKLAAISKLIFSANWQGLLSGVSVWRTKLKFILFVVFLFSFFLLALRICWGENQVVVDHRGRTILIALDISRSMLAKDLSPSRLELAKVKIKNLLPSLNANRIGLLVFANKATLQCPFTTDIRTFQSSLDQLDYSSVASGKTALDNALRESVSIFSRNDLGGSNLLLIFSDGEDFSPGLSGLLSSLEKQKIALFSVGVGTLEGGPVPIVNEFGVEVGHEKDSDGNVVFSKLGEKTLQEMSEKLLGGYARVSYSGSDEEKILNFVESFEAQKFGDQSVVGKKERYFWFAALSFSLLAIEWFI
jgi:Ca-activated chloride channel family protein